MSFLLSYHDWRFKINVKDDKQLMIAWLEKEMFDITEENICHNNQCYYGYTCD